MDKHNAILLFGFPNRDDVTVSPDIAALGLNLLRTSTDALSVSVLPDMAQARYGDYLFNLSAFLYSHQMDTPTSSVSAGFPLNYKNLQAGQLLPFKPPHITLAWNKDPSTEDWAAMQSELAAIPGVSGGHAAMVYTPPEWEDLGKIRGLRNKPNFTATAPVETVNTKCAVAMRDILALLSVLYHTHKYPAYIDDEHFEAIANFEVRDPTSAMDIDGTTMYNKPVHNPYGNPGTIHSQSYMYVDMAKDKVARSTVSPWLDTDSGFNCPKGDGLWCPYLPAVANYDKTTVPTFIERFLYRSLGETVEDCVEGLRFIKGEWPMAGMTSVGKEISHMVKVTEVALLAQARAIPVFRGKEYLGCFINGAGYTVDLNSRAYRPQPFGVVEIAYNLSDIHTNALLSICNLVGGAGNAAAVAAVRAAKTFWDLHVALITNWIKEETREDILKAARGLRYEGDLSWAVNIGTIKNAFDLIRDPMPLSAAAKIPVHHSALFSTDKKMLVWSGFGGMAPSFMVPGGKIFPLDSDMSVDSKLKSGGVVKKSIVRITVRNKPLAAAVKDLDEMMEKKHIQNPIAAAKIRTSQVYQDKIFVNDNGKALMDLLRVFCEVHLDSGRRGTKRGREDDDAEEPGKKRHRVGNMDDF